VSLSSLKARLGAAAAGWAPAFARAGAATAALRQPRERLRIGLAPGRVVIARDGGMLSARPPRAGSIAVEPHAGLPRWQPAVDALAAALTQPGTAKCRATVILSSHFARYAVLPWNATLKNDEEWRAYAQHRLQAVHGSVIEDWELRVCETAPRGARIACAVDRALLDALEAAVAGNGGRLESVQPYLMSAFNRARLATDASCWFVVEEPGRLTLALIEDGTWRSVRGRRVDSRWRHALADILERESAALGLERPCTDVVIHAEAGPAAGSHDGLRVRDLAAGIADDERALAMVLR